MKLLRLNLRAKTILFLVIISLVGSASLALMLSRTKRVLAQEFRNEEMTTVQNFVVGTLKPVMLGGHGNLMSSIMASYKKNLGIKDLRILRTNGMEAFLDDETMNKVNQKLNEKRFTRELRPSARALPEDDPLLVKAVSTGERVVFNKSEDAEEQETTMLVPIKLEEPCKACHGDDHKIRGVLVASFGMTEAGRTALGDISSLAISAFTRLLLPLVVISLYINWAITNRISKIVAEVNEIVGADKFDRRITVQADDEIGRLSISFNHFISSVEIYREEEKAEKERLETAVFEKTKELREKNDFIESDLKMARRIQQRLMPEKFPDLAEIDFHARYLPSLYIGGDYYDIIEMPNGYVGIFMADASGHGSSAALLVSIVKAVVSTVGKDISSPGYVVEIINSTLAKITPDDAYVTLFYGIIELKTGIMTYSLAGHPPPIIHNRITGKLEDLKTNGGLVGIFDVDEFNDTEYAFKPGDRLFIYTDGLTEATIEKGREQFGPERVKRQISANGSATGGEMTSRLMAEFEKFTGGEALSDDITLMVVDYKKT